MVVSTEQARKIVIDCIKESLEQAGYDVLEPITDDTQPIGDLGLDSPMGVNFACAVTARGIVVPDNENPFVDDTHKKRARTIREIVEYLINLATKQNKEPTKHA